MSDSEWRGWVWAFWCLIGIGLALVIFAAYMGLHS